MQDNHREYLAKLFKTPASETWRPREDDLVAVRIGPANLITNPGRYRLGIVREIPGDCITRGFRVTILRRNERPTYRVMLDNLRPYPRDHAEIQRRMFSRSTS